MAKDKKGSLPTGRRATVRVKTARGRTVSSQRWLQRQLNDPYVEEAKKRGYRSRAAFKLLQIDDQFKILKPGARIIDLAPRRADGRRFPSSASARARTRAW